MSAKPETAKGSRPTSRRIEHVRVRYRAPFALRCGAILIDYIVLALILTFSTLVARLMGGGARLAGGTAENIGLLFTLVAAILDLVVLAGLTGKTLTDLERRILSQATPYAVVLFGRNIGDAQQFRELVREVTVADAAPLPRCSMARASRTIVWVASSRSVISTLPA